MMFLTVASSGAIERRCSIGLCATVAIFTLASTSAAEVFESVSCISIIAPELYAAGGALGRSDALNWPSTAFTAISRSCAVVYAENITGSVPVLAAAVFA